MILQGKFLYIALLYVDYYSIIAISTTRLAVSLIKKQIRQEGIDQLLGLHPAVKTASPAEVAIQKAMASRISEYTTSATVCYYN